MRRRLSWISVLVAVALVAAACGGSDSSASDASGEDGESSAPPTTADSSDGQDADEVEIVPADLADFEATTERQAAARATETLGDAALDAVAAAINAGYSTEQIVGALGADTLQADGTIEATEPAGESSDALQLTAFGAGGDDDGFRVVLVGVEGDTVRDVLLEYGADFNSNNPSEGAIVLLLLLTAMGYTAEQITELLIAPESFEFRRVPSTYDATSYEGGAPHIVQVDTSCLLIFDVVTGDPLLPVLTPQGTPCRRAVWRLRNDRSDVVFLEGELTTGTIIQGETIAEVVRNELGFQLNFDSGLVNGDGTVSRRAVLPDEECTDEKISPLGFTFQGEFVDDEQRQMEGDFWYRVKAEEYVDLDPCDDTLTRWGTGRGTWSGEWDPDAGRVDGELTVSSGSFGTNEFELSTAG